MESEVAQLRAEVKALTSVVSRLKGESAFCDRDD